MKSLRRIVASAAIASLAALAAGGCKSVTTGAKEHFTKDFTCPEERVEVRVRADLHPSDFEKGKVPPAEVAADPARMKMWQTETDNARTTEDANDQILEARGCDHETLYACHRHNKEKNYVICTTKPYPPGIAKW